MNVEIRDRRFTMIVHEDIKVERIATGFQFTEGPVWHGDDKRLLFSDIPGNRMHTWDAKKGIGSYREPSNMANGNVFDREHRLVTCEHATSRVTRRESDGSTTVLADNYKGKALNSPNDIIVASDGAVYFTDPDFGRRDFFGVPREKELAFRGVYRIDPVTGKLEVLLDDFEQPNGLTFSPDESLLYVNDTPRRHIRVFDVTSNGGVANGRLFADITGEGKGGPDGLKTDSNGNVFCTGPGGIHILDTAGTTLGVVRIPEQTANFNWIGDQRTTIVATASTSLYRFPVKIAGRAAW